MLPVEAGLQDISNSGRRVPRPHESLESKQRTAWTILHGSGFTAPKSVHAEGREAWVAELP